MEACLVDSACADLRAALRDALNAAEAGGLSPEIQITLMVAELGQLIAGSGDDEFETLLANTLKAVKHAARTARNDLDYQAAVERFVERWLN